MLLHANRLNAEMIDGVLRLSEEKHFKFATLDIAQSDPACSTPNTFVTRMRGCGAIAGLLNVT
jgi:hypothetical protein